METLDDLGRDGSTDPVRTDKILLERKIPLRSTAYKERSKDVRVCDPKTVTVGLHLRYVRLSNGSRTTKVLGQPGGLRKKGNTGFQRRRVT